MILAVLLGLAVTNEAGVAASTAVAMYSAVAMGCFLHASGASPIRANRRKALEAAGLAYVDAPPATFASDVARLPPGWGKPSFAKVSWANGMAWVVGFENGQCLIDVTADDGSALIRSTHEQFETPGVPWRKLPPGAAPERYGMAVQPPGKPAIAIVANIVGTDLPPAGRRQVITFGITPNK